MIRRVRMVYDPEIQHFGDWLPANEGFYERFRDWMKDSCYSDSTICIYSVAVRKVIGLLKKPYWTISSPRVSQSPA